MNKIKTLFISDVHLGNPNSQADKLLKIFKEYDFENLFIIGDFIDMTYLKRKIYWNQSHSTVIQKILRLSRKDCNVVYIVGNHDFYIRSVIEEENIHFGKILICNDYVYITKRGESIYLTHGDCFDGFVRISPWLYWLGDVSYELSISINKVYNWFRRLFKLEYWSFSAYMKSKVKSAIKFLAEYKKISEATVNQMGCDSIMIGHTHSPEIIQGKYYNTGDWCESCSYIIEDLDGNIKLKYVK
jgi:UDP-2,3-diacylglucosamine pyrophosphatase LpxH